MPIEVVPVTKLHPHPDNPRQGDVGAIVTSIQQNGWYGTLVAQTSTGRVLAGNHRLQAAAQIGMTEVPVYWVDVDDVTARKILLADNRTNDLATYDDDLLSLLLTDLASTDDLLGTGYDGDDLDDLLGDLAGFDPIDDPGPGEPPAVPVTKLGDVILLGEHRLVCGDTTDPAVLTRLLDGDTCTLIHADPPYGMGKEKDGIANDNLRNEKLDAFQMLWWAGWRDHLTGNGSVYIWGNPADLWRLWYTGGLAGSERLTFRNEIVWSKGTGFGVAAEAGRSYAPATERCLFFMRGEQGFNNNADNYWEGWEPIRSALADDCEKMGWGPADIKRITGVGMFSHWFTTSQWVFITEKHYRSLQAASRGHDAFKRDHDELKRDHDELKRDHDELKRDFYATRAHFDNTHDNMTDVWEYGRVHGEDRHGHATPKPVPMVARAILSSSEPGDLVGVPFAGTCPEIIAAEQTGRRIAAAELDPAYCDVIVNRWEEATGKEAIRP